MAWFEWSQNNSGGSFINDGKVTHRVWIEAHTLREAEAKAFDLGIYYNGCADGRDCSCCGDRWYSPEQYEFPMDYRDYSYPTGYEDLVFNSPEGYAQYLKDQYGWEEPDSILYHQNGNITKV